MQPRACPPADGVRALVVLAHPLGDSLNASLAAHVRAALGSDAAFIDLYAENFDPRLTADERASYYADAHDTRSLATHAEALQAAELLVFVFPTWWFGPPAILKGWIDRVFAPGIAFDHGTNFGPIVPRLTKLRHAMVVTTLGTPWWVDRLVMRRPVKRMFGTAILGACAPKARFHYLPLYAAERPTEQALANFRARISRTLGTILQRR